MAMSSFRQESQKIPQRAQDSQRTKHVTIAILLLSNLVSAFVVRPKSRPFHEINEHHKYVGPSPTLNRRMSRSFPVHLAINGDDNIDNVSDDEFDDIPTTRLLDDDEDILSPSSLKNLTIAQLKQQLRLRGLKVSGKKQDLIHRLLQYQGRALDEELDSADDATVLESDEILSEREIQARQSYKAKKQSVTLSNDKEYIDVTAYLDKEDQGKDVKTSLPSESDLINEDNPPLSDPETWGIEAKIVNDFEGRSPVVDGLSRTIVEYKGSNQTMVQAFVVASRDAMKPFLQGGKNTTIANNDDPEARLREIQLKREQAEKRPVRLDDTVDESGDEPGHYTDALHRDYSDWGKYSVTGAQISSQEVQGILILSDVYGPFTEATKALAEKIAFECQPVVCMVPDLFRGKPWKEEVATPGFNEEGQDYEEWRASHPEVRVSIDIRAAAAVLRERYGVSSIVVWGTCYGGGRALETVADYLPRRVLHDVDGTIGPMPVEPDVAVVWYPTRYNASELFGANRAKTIYDMAEFERNFAVIGIFGGNDKLPGATPDDAEQLRNLLVEDHRVKDHMIKIFPEQDHGFAHNALGQDQDESEFDRFVDDEFGGAGRVTIHDGDAEVACLLSTAFMETYSRKFLPTTGPPISRDESASEWNKDLNMKNVNPNERRNIRQEIEESLGSFKEDLLEGKYIDPSDKSQEDELLRALSAMEPENVDPDLKIQDDDDLATVYAKLTTGDDKFQIF